MRAILATISAPPPVRPLRVNRALSRSLSVGSHSRHSKRMATEHFGTAVKTWEPLLAAELDVRIFEM